MINLKLFILTIFGRYLKGRVILSSGLLLLSSKFGYILTGKYYDSKAAAVEGESTSLTTIHNPCLSDMWNLDSIGIHESPNVKDDRALEEFNRTVCYKEQRYYVMWPWRSPGIELPDNSVLPLGG